MNKACFTKFTLNKACLTKFTMNKACFTKFTMNKACCHHKYCEWNNRLCDYFCVYEQMRELVKIRQNQGAGQVPNSSQKGDDVTTEQNRNNELTVVTTDLAWVSSDFNTMWLSGHEQDFT